MTIRPPRLSRFCALRVLFPLLLLLVLAAGCGQAPVGPEPNPIRTTWNLEAPLPTSQHLWGVWGTSASNVWAVGGFGSEIVHYDGVDWRVVESPLDQDAIRRLGPRFG